MKQDRKTKLIHSLRGNPDSSSYLNLMELIEIFEYEILSEMAATDSSVEIYRLQGKVRFIQDFRLDLTRKVVGSVHTGSFD